MAKNSIVFEDYSIKALEAMSDTINAALAEVAGEIVRQTQRNSRKDSGYTAGSFRYVVDETKHEAIIGSLEENAIWEEFGTGEYALNGDGRKGGWYYEDENGKWHFTNGKTPTRAMFKAYIRLKPKIINHFQKEFKAEFKGGFLNVKI